MYTKQHSKRNKLNSKVKYENYTCNKTQPATHKAVPLHGSDG